MDDAWEAWYDQEAAYVEGVLTNVVLYQVTCPQIAGTFLKARLDERDFVSEAYRYEYRETEITTGNTRDVREPDSLEWGVPVFGRRAW